EETTGGTTGGELCDPPSDVAFEFQLVPGPEDFVDVEYDWLCTVQEVAPYKDGGTGVTMSCTDGDETVSPDPTLVIDAKPATDLVAFSKGMAVRMVYGQAVPWWTERWVRVESVGSGDLLIAGTSGSGLAPSEIVDLFAPFNVEVMEGVCAPQEDFCGTIERLEVDFIEPQGDPPIAYPVLDGTFEVIAGDPGISTWVVTAQGFVGEIQCTDTPSHWYSIGMVFDGNE
ncbi:MAG: hypothetical protein KC420_16215, partial [Myxococcales bacterium]|nr:hypothetical protein [Myxococcales bacterium]